MPDAGHRPAAAPLALCLQMQPRAKYGLLGRAEVGMARIRVEPGRGRRNLTWLWILLAVLVIGAAVAWWLYDQRIITVGGF
jgi:hypothetical protein